VKAIKIEEKGGNLLRIRQLLGLLNEVPFEKVWRLILEGALFEGRNGNKEGTRTVFKYLISNC
jgi:hypothetical protein